MCDVPGVFYTWVVGMVIELSEQAAARVAAAARARGVSETAIIEELTQTLTPAGTGDVLDAFIGCGSSGDRKDRSIHDLRDELSAAQLRDTA